jgi:type I restriction enzyme R subunit
MATAEQRARANIEKLLQQAGWSAQDVKAANVLAARGAAPREFDLNAGHGTADYLLFVDRKAAGVIEAKKQGATRSAVQQGARRAPANLMSR